MEQVIFEVFGHLVVVDYVFGVLLVLEWALEEVERAVVCVVDQVLEVVFEGDAQFVPVVVLANLELGLLEVLVEVGEGPGFVVPWVGAAFRIII